MSGSLEVPVTGTGRVCGMSASSAPRVTTISTPRSRASAEQLGGEGAPAHVRLDAVHEDDVAGRERDARDRDAGRGPDDLRACRPRDDLRAVHLEVVVVLGVDLAERLASQTSSRCSTAPLAASPASFHPSKAQSMTGSTRSGRARADPRSRSPAPLAPRVARPRRPGIRPTYARNGVAAPPAREYAPRGSPASPIGLPHHDAPRLRPRVRPANGAGHPRGRRRRRHGHDAAGRRPDPRRLRGPRGLQRDPQRHPPRRRARGPRRVLRGGRRLRRDQHLRRQPRQPRRVRHRRPDRRAGRGRRAPSPARSPTASRTPDRPRWVLGSVGPGTKLPTLGHAPYADLRDAYEAQAARPASRAAPTRSSSRPRRTCCRPRPRSSGAKRAIAHHGVDVPVIAQVTVETTGTMLLGTEIGAALTALEPLGIDMIGLNCATGPAEMSEHLRHLARHAQIGVSCMPNAGLPVLTARRRLLPADPRGARRRARHVHARVRPRPGRRLLRHHARAPAPGRRAGRRP